MRSLRRTRKHSCWRRRWTRRGQILGRGACCTEYRSLRKTISPRNIRKVRSTVCSLLAKSQRGAILYSKTQRCPRGPELGKHYISAAKELFQTPTTTRMQAGGVPSRGWLTPRPHRRCLARLAWLASRSSIQPAQPIRCFGVYI